MADRNYFIPEEESLGGADLAALQRRKLARLIDAVRGSNAFYQRKFAGLSFDALTDRLDQLPFTARAEIEADQADHPAFGSNLTEPLDRYPRYHQTSGTGGRPVRWLDTTPNWDWFKRCWGIIFTAAGVGRGDRAFFPFSFGPFVGFWAAFEAATSLGLMSIPAGGLSTTARLKMLLENQATVVCCTPTYAQHMAEVAAKEGIDLSRSSVRALIVAGEAGGNIPETRNRIETAWGARLYDHSGMTEIGPAAFECGEVVGGLHVIESEFIPEVINPETGAVLADGAAGELVLTNLGRVGSPLIRYRTGDQVRLSRGVCRCGRSFARLEGGILGRLDDMFTVRGNNVFPNSVEALLRRFDEVAEFRVTVRDVEGLAQVKVELEPRPPAGGSPAGNGDVAETSLATRMARAMQDGLNFRADVSTVPPGTLPRFEMKAKRFVRVR